MKRVVFVCTGNICRSPMAAGLLRRHIAALGLTDQVEVSSAGVYAEAGHPASRFATAVLRLRGVDLAEHRSQRATVALLKQADIILVMEEAHRKTIFYETPQLLPKVFLLTEMAGESEDVSDPYGGPIEEYGATADLLEDLIARGLPRILKRLGITA